MLNIEGLLNREGESLIEKGKLVSRRKETLIEIGGEYRRRVLHRTGESVIRKADYSVEGWLRNE